MKQSSRAKRRVKHHQRLNAGGKLNLVALMDIFTILVFFLIVNQSEVRVLQNIEKIKLPVSVADELPVENLVITVLEQTILVQERAIWQQSKSVMLDDAAPSKKVDVTNHNAPVSALLSADFFQALTTELNYQAGKRPQLTAAEQLKGRGVTIIGDASVPYAVLKQIMAACAQTGYRDMSLAVEKQALPSDSEG